MSVQIAPQLSDQFSVFLVICFGLESLVLDQKLAGLFPCLFFGLGKFFLKLVSLGVELHLDYVQLAFRFVVLLTESVNFVLLRVKLDSVAPLNVFLNFHAHDVRVDGQGHLVGHRVDLPLLLLDSTAHVIEALLHCQL